MNTFPPAELPAAVPGAPVTPAELEAARTGAARRGSRLGAGLAALVALSVLPFLIGALALRWAWAQLPGWLGELGTTPGSAAGDPNALLPAWAVPALLVLALLGVLLNSWGIWQARETIKAIRAYTLQPNADHADELARQARVVRPWITLTQYAPIILAVFTTLLSLGLTSGLGQLGSQLPDTNPDAFVFGPSEGLLVGLMSAAQWLPGLVITWLIMAAIRRWLDAVVHRSQGQPQEVRPAARRVDPWLLFTLVILGLQLLSLSFSGLLFLFFPAMLGPLAASEGAADQQVMQAMQGAFAFLGALLLVSAALCALLAALMAWSRGFALDVATVLDAGLNPGPGSGGSSAQLQAPDPWAGPVQRATPRPPR